MYLPERPISPAIEKAARITRIVLGVGVTIVAIVVICLEYNVATHFFDPVMKLVEAVWGLSLVIGLVAMIIWFIILGFRHRKTD